MTIPPELHDALSALLAARGLAADGREAVWLRSMWTAIPLTHRFNGVLEDPEGLVADGTLPLLAREGGDGRQALGTGGCAFAAVGVAPYWEPPLVLIFELAEDTALPLVCPWDTRLAARELNLPSEAGRDFIARYTFEGPDAEAYFPTLWAACFSGEPPYLDGGEPVQADPAGAWARALRPNSQRRLTPSERGALFATEARFPGGIALSADQLIAVLADEDKIGPRLEPSRMALQRLVQRRGGGVYRSLSSTAGAVHYRDAAAAIVREHLRAGGWT